MKTIVWYLKDEIIWLVFWIFGMGAYIGFVVVIYPEFGDTFASMMFNTPIMKLFMGQFAPDLMNSSSLDAFLGMEFFAWFGILAGFFPLIFASETIAGETEKGTMDILLAQPISRSRLLLGKFAAIVILLAVLCIACFTIMVAAVALYLPQSPSIFGYACTFLNGYLLLLVITAFGFLCSALVGSQRASLSVSITVVILFFIFYEGLSAFKIAPWFTRLIPFHYANPIKTLANSHIYWGDNLMLTFMTAICLSLALIVFQRKDIAT